MSEFDISRKYEVIGIVAAILSYRRSSRRAVEFREQCRLAEVKENEAQNAIKFLLSKGMRIRVTDNLPHRLYWGKDE